MKTKVEVRAKALELAVTISAAQLESGNDTGSIIGVAKLYEEYILGNAELPECEPSAEVMVRRMMPSITALYKDIDATLKTPPTAMGIVNEYFANIKKDGE